MKAIYLKLSPAEQIKICSINKNAIKGIYPVLGRKPRNSLNKYCSKQNTFRIKQYIKAFGQIFLPKHILIYKQGFCIYVGPKVTRFSERSLSHFKLDLVEFENFFLITKKSDTSQAIQIDTAHISLNAPSSYDVSDRPHETDSDIASESNALNIADREIEDNSRNTNQNPASNDMETNDTNGEEDHNSSDDDSVSTEPLFSSKYRNMLLTPEKYSNDQIISLIHCSKLQFKNCVENLRPFMKGISENILSVNARVFLFRLKVKYIILSWYNDKGVVAQSAFKLEFSKLHIFFSSILIV